MKIITPVFLDVLLLFCYMNKKYRQRGSKIARMLSVLLLMLGSLVIEQRITKGNFTQLLIYLLVMPVILLLFQGNVIAKAKEYLKFLLYLSIANFVGEYLFLDHGFIKNVV